jgi:hypothetical protein
MNVTTTIVAGQQQEPRWSTAATAQHLQSTYMQNYLNFL